MYRVYQDTAEEQQPLADAVIPGKGKSCDTSGKTHNLEACVMYSFNFFLKSQILSDSPPIPPFITTGKGEVEGNTDRCTIWTPMGGTQPLIRLLLILFQPC